jgi:hypothetical protein
MTPQRWKAVLPFIQAFVNGQNVQYHNGIKWNDMLDCTFTNPPGAYRIKPNVIKSRRYLWENNGRYVVALATEENHPTNFPESWYKFVKWLDEDWVEHELPTSTTSVG